MNTDTKNNLKVVPAERCSEIGDVCRKADLLVNGDIARIYGPSPLFTPTTTFVAILNGELVGAARMEKGTLCDIAVLEGHSADAVGQRFHDLAMQETSNNCISFVNAPDRAPAPRSVAPPPALNPTRTNRSQAASL